MRFRYILTVMVSLLLLLTACQSDDEINADVEQTNGEPVNEEIEESDDNILNDEIVADEIEETDNEEDVDQSIDHLKDLFHRMEEALQSVNSVSIRGQSVEKIIIADNLVQGAKEMILHATFDPFAQHAIVTEEEAGTTEWYATEEGVYVNYGDSGWVEDGHPLMLEATKLIHHTGYFEHLADYEELFSLSEDNEFYLISYIGSEQQYDEVFHEVDQAEDFHDMVEGMLGMHENVEMAGTVEMKVAKDTFLVMEQQSTYKAMIENDGITLETEQTGSYAYRYNEIDKLEIPEELR